MRGAPASSFLSVASAFLVGCVCFARAFSLDIIRRTTMPVSGGRVFPALMLAAFATKAAAQAKACDLDEGTPSQVTRAVLDLQLASSASKPEDAANKLREAVKFLNEGDMK